MSVIFGAPIALALFAALVVWVKRVYSPDEVSCFNGLIILKSQGKKSEVLIAQLTEIKFHYSAVGGYIGVWEFVAKGGHSMHVDSEAKGLKQLLTRLEDSLSGFSVQEFDRKFAAGDVQDTLDVWRAA